MEAGALGAGRMPVKLVGCCTALLPSDSNPLVYFTGKVALRYGAKVLAAHYAIDDFVVAFYALDK